MPTCQQNTYFYLKHTSTWHSIILYEFLVFHACMQVHRISPFQNHRFFQDKMAQIVNMAYTQLDQCLTHSLTHSQTCCMVISLVKITIYSIKMDSVSIINTALCASGHEEHPGQPRRAVFGCYSMEIMDIYWNCCCFWSTGLACGQHFVHQVSDNLLSILYKEN